MGDEELEEVVRAYDFPPSCQIKAMALAREVERTTRHRNHKLINMANEAIYSREIGVEKIRSMLHGGSFRESDGVS